MRAWIALIALLLSACGFQLRGAYALPFDTLHIGLPSSLELHAQLKRAIESSSKTRVTETPQGAQATLAVGGDVFAKNILSLSPAGRVTEFQLVRTFAFRVIDPEGRDLLPPGQIVIRRDISFSDATVLSKESEELLLQRDMQADLVQQLMRRLAAAKLAPIGG